ncbi:glycosyltransferase family 2 protein [Bacteroides bouchesdurhonensis]|uniref:glycosyltransferase family 2 protein n=1 Tax=Bacteroides bouchesdurhonensis TaxID=1841855 RepID=UPI00097F7A34|nr:glycosyltransferase family 2 protein [Bacteroides bouchesdurhonensis]
MVSVSIIIPVYKVEEYIAECLYSVIAQSYKKQFECIIVDDCTPDHSIEIVNQVLSSYHGNIQFKIIHHQENKGLSAARNTGVRAAKGDYLYFLDSDDILPEQALELLLLSCEGYSPDVIMGDFELIGEDINVAKLNTHIDYYHNQKDIFNAFISHDLYEMAWNKLVQRSFFLRHKLWFKEGLIHEDNLWSFFLFFYCENLRINFSKTYKYRIRKNSIMTDLGNYSKSFISCNDIFFIKMDFISEKNLWADYPLLVNYMLSEKLSLQKKIVIQRPDRKLYAALRVKLPITYVINKKTSLFVKMKLVLSNLPFSLFKLIICSLYINKK